MISEPLDPGEHEMKLRLNYPPGLYYLRLYDGQTIQTRKIVRQ